MNKKIILLPIFCLFVIGNLQSQDGKETKIHDVTNNVDHVEKTCQYPGGQGALNKDIVNNFVIPKRAKKDGLTGTIYLQLAIDTLGQLNPKILKGLREDVDSAVIKMAKKLKQFSPDEVDGRKVPTTLTIPIKL